MTEISLRGEALELHAERAIFWKRKRALLISDTHWGKAATMRSAGIPIPGGTTTADLDRLSRLLDRTGAKRIILLGDAIHAKDGRAPKTLDAVARWRERHAYLDILLVRGNHDARAGDPPSELNIRCVDAPFLDEPFVFQHFPAPSPHGYPLGGHIHPAVRMGGRAGEALTLPCFHFTPAYGTLPAFGSMTGCSKIKPSPADLVYAIADSEVVKIET